MTGWFSYAIGAAVFYGLHQVFTKLAAAGASDGLGGFVVEATAASTIGFYLIYLRLLGGWDQHINMAGTIYSIITGVCVGVGTILFFLLFAAGGPLSAVPGVLAAGAVIMVLAGVLIFHEPLTWQRSLGIGLSIAGILFLKRT